MPAGTDLIFFDNSQDWQVIVNTSRIATRLPGDRFVPISSFDLGVSLKTDYIAVVAGTTEGKSNWFFAGDITQVYDFSPGRGNPILGEIKPERTRLAINRLQLVETNRVSTDNFRLQYTPPYWFRDCTIRVYQYTGDKLNFVEDSLFEIGNALGIDPNQPEGRIIEALLALKLDIENQFIDISEKLEVEDVASEEAQLQLIEKMNQLNAGVYTIAEGLADLLPGDRGEQIRSQTQNRLNLDLGFL